MRRLLKLVPAPIRRGVSGLVENHLPPSWQLPYTNAKLWLRGALEEEISWLARLLPTRGGVAIDVGANIGLYSYHLARLCDRVEAFEPNENCLAVLKAYGAPNIRTHGIALSSKTGTATLRIPVVGGVQQPGLASVETPSAGDFVAIQVPTRDLDSFSFDDVRVMKIDVEGHELEVLAGADRTIRKHRPLLLLEIEQRHQKAPMADVLSAISAMGYAGFFVFEDRLVPVASFDVDYHQKRFLSGEQRIKYVNNFFFAAPAIASHLSNRLKQ